MLALKIFGLGVYLPYEVFVELCEVWKQLWPACWTANSLLFLCSVLCDNPVARHGCSNRRYTVVNMCGHLLHQLSAAKSFFNGETRSQIAGRNDCNISYYFVPAVAIVTVVASSGLCFLAIFAVGHRENNKLAVTHRQHLLLLSTIMKSRMFASGHRFH